MRNPALSPAYRSVSAFLQRLLDSTPGQSDEGAEEHDACDIPAIPNDTPAMQDDPAYVKTDRALVRALRDAYDRETDADRRRLCAQSAIALTPVADTASVIPFLFDPDMWTPEAAVALLERRHFTDAIPALERLAAEGHSNGDYAAIRLLVIWNTPESQAAITRLKKTSFRRKT